jgi:hypothetical protein
MISIRPQVDFDKLHIEIRDGKQTTTRNFVSPYNFGRRPHHILIEAAKKKC